MSEGCYTTLKNCFAISALLRLEPMVQPLRWKLRRTGPVRKCMNEGSRTAFRSEGGPCGADWDRSGKRFGYMNGM
jgi:hypothetical protein